MRDPTLTGGDEEQKRQLIQTACVADRITEGDADASVETTDVGPEALQRDVSPCSVLASDPNVGAACNLHRGCIPFAVPEGVPIHGHEDERFAAAITIAKQAKLAKSGDKIVLAHGVRHGVLSLSNFKLVKLA